MADLQCTWNVIRTDCYEIVTEEYCDLQQLLAEITELVKAWDDPNEKPPEFVLSRSTPEERKKWEAHWRSYLAKYPDGSPIYVQPARDLAEQKLAGLEGKADG